MRTLRLWARAVGVEYSAVVQRVWFDAEADGGAGEVVVHVRPYRNSLPRCGRCGVVAPGYDNGVGRRRWRALDQGPVKVWVEADAPRVDCPEHGPTVIQVPWARHKARHTRMFDAAVVWMVRCAAKSVVAMFFQVAWPTVGMMIGRFVAGADAVAGDRLANVRKIGIDEVSYKRGHKYLVVVVNHFTGDLLWVGVGRGAQREDASGVL